MKLSSLAPVLVSAVLGGAVGSAVTLAVRRPEPTKREPPTAARPEPRMEQAESEDGEDLSPRLRSLERRVSLLTAALAKGGGAALPAEGKPGEAAPAEGATEDVASPVFEAAVRDILDRVDEERREERQNRRGAFVEQSAHDVSDRLGDKLGLTDDQRAKVAEIVKQSYESMGALRDLPPEQRPKTPAEWRERRDAQKQRVDEGLRQVLTPAQMQTYEQLPEEEQITTRRPWRWRPGSGPQGPGLGAGRAP